MWAERLDYGLELVLWIEHVGASKFNNSVQVPEIKYRSSTGCVVKVHKMGKSITPIC